jgi:DNA polymerase (family 10)
MGGKLVGCGSVFSRTDVKETADKIASVLSSFGAYTTFTIVGSYRRGLPFCNDLDILITVMNEEQEAGFRKAMFSLGQGDLPENRQAVSLAYGMPGSKLSMQVDIFVVRDMARYATELMCWTGPFRHNIALRRLAIRTGMKLSQHGLSMSGVVLKTASEADVFAKLSLPLIPPEKRDSYATEETLILLSKAVADGSFDVGG